MNMHDERDLLRDPPTDELRGALCVAAAGLVAAFSAVFALGFVTGWLVMS